LNELEFDENTVFQPWVSPREKELRASLWQIYEAENGNTATRLWRAVVAAWPAVCAVVLRTAEASKGRGGRCWADLWRLIDAVELQIEYLQSDLARHSSATTEISCEAFDAAEREMAAAADALRHVMDILVSGARTERTSVPLFDTCRLCWRLGKRSRGRAYYCSQHWPRAKNTEYKRNVTLLEPSKMGDPSFYQRYRSLRHKVRIGFPLDSPSLHALEELMFGKNPTVKVSQHTLLRGFPWAKFSSLREALLGDRVELFKPTSTAIFDWLCPVEHDNTEMINEIRMLFLRDERLLLSMMVRAEAWVATSESRRKNHGGSRRNR